VDVVASCHSAGASWPRWSLVSRWSAASLPWCWPLPPRIHEHHSDHHQRAGQEESERQSLLEGTSGPEQDDEDERPDAKHPEQMALSAVVVTLHVGAHVLDLSCSWSRSNRGVAARSRGKIWETAHNPKAT